MGNRPSFQNVYRSRRPSSNIVDNDTVTDMDIHLVTNEDRSTPEYTTFRICYPQIIEYVKHQSLSFCNQIFAKGYIAEQVRDNSRHPGQNGEDKATILVDALSDRIKSDSRAFKGFLEIIKADEPLSSNLINLMQERYRSESKGVQPPVLISPIVQGLLPAGVQYIEFASLNVKDDLGSGNFSEVYLAEWMEEGGSVRRVAVKVPRLKVQNAEIVKQDVKKEIETMSKLKHRSIVALVGISEAQHYIDPIGVMPVMILEFINGTLREHLNKFKENELMKKQLERFISFSIQIADGMQYLELQKIVHRDLAARNVLLVGGTDKIKISDFGLARESIMDDKNYGYYRGKYQELPIYWYAPEGLRHLKFTSKGDVWSFGVTLWEMFSNGNIPDLVLKTVIDDLPNDADPTILEKAFNRLADHLEQPSDHLPLLNCCKCPVEIHDIIRGCWRVDPSERSSFEELSQQLSQQLKQCHHT